MSDDGVSANLVWAAAFSSAVLCLSGLDNEIISVLQQKMLLVFDETSKLKKF